MSKGRPVSASEGPEPEQVKKDIRSGGGEG